MRKIAIGSANKSFGIEVASLAGVPKEVTSNAKRILKKLEQNDTALENNDDYYEDYEDAQEENNSSLEEIVLALESADVDSMSPRQALDLIYELKNKVTR